MKVLTTIALAGSVLLFGSGMAAAQSRTITGETATITATIEAIDAQSRVLTVKNTDGTYESIVAPPGMTRFDQLKVGDRITARYYENLVIRVKRPNEAPVDIDSAAVTRGAGTGPAATAATQRTMTVTVTAKDPAKMSATVKGPNGYVYSRRVQDKKVFDMLKVGDQLDMTWTDALLISADSPK